MDPASRLLEVARARAASEHADITFVPGEAESIPAETASVDMILSVFAVIYAANPGGAAAEMARVLAPEGRLVLSAWIPAGTMVEMGGVAAESVRQAVGAPPPPDPFPWHDHAALTRLLARYGFRVHVERHSLAFTAPSAREFLDSTARPLPPAVAVLGILNRVGLAEKVRPRFLEILEAANESHDAFQITSDYIVAAARRSGHPARRREHEPGRHPGPWVTGLVQQPRGQVKVAGAGTGSPPSRARGRAGQRLTCIGWAPQAVRVELLGTGGLVAGVRRCAPYPR